METILSINEKYLEEAMDKVTRVGSFLEENGFNNYLIVGSCALLACGYPLNRPIHDIDIEVECSKDEEKIFKALADSYGNNFYLIHEEYPERVGFEHKPYIFKIGDILVNIWCVRQYTHLTAVHIDKYKFATMMSVLSKKMSYKRSKDIQDGIKFASLILDMCK